MKKKLRIVILVVGVLFFIQTGLVMYEYLSQARNIPKDADYVSFTLSLIEIRAGLMIQSVIGSLICGFGSLLLLVYLKIRDIEHQLVDRVPPPNVSAPEKAEPK
jgi:hypothetical protein